MGGQAAAMGRVEEGWWRAFGKSGRRGDGYLIGGGGGNGRGGRWRRWQGLGIGFGCWLRILRLMIGVV